MNMQGTDAFETSGLNLLSSRSVNSEYSKNIASVAIFLFIAIE
jgi:hypothetical protein